MVLEVLVQAVTHALHHQNPYFLWVRLILLVQYSQQAINAGVSSACQLLHPQCGKQRLCNPKLQLSFSDAQP